MRKKLVAAGLALIGLVIIVGLGIRLFVDADQFRPALEQTMTSALGRKVSISHLSLSVVRGRAAIENLSIADDPSFSAGPFLEAKSAQAGFAVIPLILSRGLRVESLRLQEPQLTLRRSRAGTWNVSTLGASSASESNAGGSPVPLNLSIDTIGITNGRVLVETGGARARRHVYEGVNLAARGFSSIGRFTFHTSAMAPGNGAIKFDGTAGPLGPAGLWATPLVASLAVKHLDPARTGLVEPGGFAGIVDLDFHVVSDGRRVMSTGNLRGAQFRVVPGGSPSTVPFNIACNSEYDLNTNMGVLKRGNLHVGKAVAQLNGRFSAAGERVTLQMKLTGHHMSIPDLQAALPAVGIRAPQGARFQSGTLDTDLAIVGSLDRFAMAGPVTLSNAALVGFDLGSQMRTAAFLAGIPTSSTTMIQTLTAFLHIAADGIRVDALNALVPAIGTFTGAGTIAPSGALNFNLLAKLNSSTSVQGQLLSAIMLGSSEYRIPVHVGGTMDKPVIVPDVSHVAGNLKKPKNPISGAVGIVGRLFGKRRK
jgi:AsmA protein